jgi:hypothetical protein
MDISKFETTHYYYLKMLDGKYHIFKRIEIKPSIILEEVYEPVDNVKDAEDIVSELNQELSDWSFIEE